MHLSPKQEILGHLMESIYNNTRAHALSRFSHVQLPSLCDPVDCGPPGSSVHADSPGKNTGVGCHALLQGIFPTQGSNPGIEPTFLTSPELAGGFFITSAIWEAL